MPSKKKKYNARFPPARIKKIMQKDEDVGKVAAPVPVLIYTNLPPPAKALEIFVQGLITKASHETFSRNAKTLTTSHIKQCIEQESKFDFLKDLVESVPTMNCEDDDSNHSGSSHADRHPNSRRKQKIGRESSAQGSLQSVDEPSSDEDSCDSEDSSSRDEVQTHPAERIGGASSSKAASTSTSSSASSLAHQATHHIPAAPYNSVPYQGLHPSSGAGGMMFPPPMAPHLHAAPHLPPPQGALGGNSPAMGSYMASLPQAAPHNNNHEDSDEDYDA